MRRHYWNYTETIISENDHNNNRFNNKKLLTFIKHRKTDSINVAPIKDNGILKDSPEDKAKILSKQFSNKAKFTYYPPRIWFHQNTLYLFFIFIFLVLFFICRHQ